MTAKIARIFGKSKPEDADHDDLATELEYAAYRVRNGDMDAVRAILIYERHDSRIGHVALGEPITTLESMGMCAWAMEDIKND